MARLQRVAGLLEHAHRRRVPLEHARVQAAEVEGHEGILGQGGDRFGGDAAAPVGFAEPVTDLRRAVEDVVAELDADAADGLAVHRDGEVRHRRLRARAGDPRVGVGGRVRMGQPRKVAPHATVVRVADERGLVAHAPRPQGAPRQFEFHGPAFSHGSGRARGRHGRRYNRGSMRPAPPLAKRVPKTDVVHGERREDEYSWLRDKDSPEVTAYLEAENAYTDAAMKGSEAFQDALYKEMLARIKEDDSSVPYRRGPYVDYARTETGKQYPIHCRRRDVPGAPEEITLDLNRMAEGHAFLSLGVHPVRVDARLLAYSVGFTGFRDYTLHVKDLESGALLPDRVEKVSSAAWSADNSILFYVTEDEAKRPYRLWRHRLGAADDDLLLEETDELFRPGVFRSRSRQVVFAAARSFTSGDYRPLRAADPCAPGRTSPPRGTHHES